MEKRDPQQIIQDFALRRTNQIIAIVAVCILVLLLGIIYKYPDILGMFSKELIVPLQVLLILAFINFTAFNWKCPSCKKYAGNELNRRICKHCGTRLR